MQIFHVLLKKKMNIVYKCMEHLGRIVREISKIIHLISHKNNKKYFLILQLIKLNIMQ